MQNLVIVESPTKAKTLSKYLGDKYRVEASMGHVRDLPKGDIGVDIAHNFEPKYIIPRDKSKKVNELKKLAKDAKTLWLATDPDREGEAIAWHLKELLGGSNTRSSSKRENEKTSHEIKRVVFHEITEDAIKEAFNHPRSLDMQLIDAQQARRILDRLVGYKLSPLLWRKVKSGLSAGRVQSVALRLIIEREREVEAFKPVEYWSVEATLQCRPRLDRGPINNPDSRIRGNDSEETSFIATLTEFNGKKLAIKNKEEADTHVANLKKADYQVAKVTHKEVKKHPAPPFTTSSLQQTASNRLGFSAKRTMQLAQVLYEHGLITYMRTDSLNLSPQAITAARDFITQNIGKNYLPPSPKVYKTKSKVAQEAHEAIRPTNIKVTVDDLKTMEGMTRDHVRVYDMIWKRMVASQMNEAVFDSSGIDIKAGEYTFRATGSTLTFDGWMIVYGKIQEEEGEGEEKILPELTEGEILKLLNLLPAQHFTEPPARFNEASLIKKLEELSIGRPSTYAPIISTILERYYVEKKEKKFFSTSLGMAVVDFLTKYFPDIVDYAFTASMEDELDNVANGESKWQPIISDFYLPFEKKITEVDDTAVKVKIEAEMVDQTCPKCGKNLQVKFGKFGKFLACSGFPDCKYTESIEEKVNIPCPDCGGEVVVRKTRKGRPFYGCKNWPNCKFASWTKPSLRPNGLKPKK